MSMIRILAFIFAFTGVRLATSNKTAPPPSPMDDCDGIFVQYQFNNSVKIYPHVDSSNASELQPYAFSAFLTVTNMGAHTLRSWRAFVGFNHNEVLVTAPGAVLPDEEDFPALVGNGTFFSGYPQVDLKTAIDTAGDPAQYQVNITLTGTEFGVAPPTMPMLNNLSLANDGYSCPTATVEDGSNNRTMMYVCCPYDGSRRYSRNETVEYVPRETGDIELYYDVTQTFESSYFAQITINNSNPLGRVDNWKLSWHWMRAEFIANMRGAYTLLRDASECIYGAQAKHYDKLDFAQVMNCQRTPTIVDLPLGRYNDTHNGMIDFCCRNGTLLPYAYDPMQAQSRFLMQVYKMPPDLNMTKLYPPENWKFNGSDPDVKYECGNPIRVTPSLFRDPSGLQSHTVAIASWQVVCNITKTTPPVPRCCVSFSAYYNESVIPCKTCSCGCRRNGTDDANCDPNASALLLPPEALLVPFANRTVKALAWAEVNHFFVPNPLPCPDHCGISINWHVYTNYNKGWSARVTVFNWEDVNIEDWFAAVVMEKAFLGYQRMYSFNGTTMTDPKNTLFMHGLVNHTYLLGLDRHSDPTKPPVPGKEQSVIAFTKETTPAIDIAGVDGFPSKVFFNGEECTLPVGLPSGDSPVAAYAMSLLSSLLVAALVFVLMDQLQ